MIELVTGKFFPRWFIDTLPDALFRGRVKSNNFLIFAQKLTPSIEFVPPALVCLLAVHLNQCEYEAGEVVFQKLDYPFHLYLVMRGSFANVAIPSPTGGTDAPASVLKASSLPTPCTMDRRDSWNNKTFSALLAPAEAESPCEKSPRETDKVYPYRSYSSNNYFGDFELIENSRPRASTVRCETPAGLCLVLAKDAFFSICEQFPQYASPWLLIGRRRDWFRTRQCRQLRHGLSLESLSAVRIQRHWRKPHRAQNTDSGKHRTDEWLSMRPPAKEDVDQGCMANGSTVQDINELTKDVDELKDMMKHMAREMAALRRRNDGVANDSGLETQ
jgi:CRP-like cAMP-binding protein